MDHEAVKTLVVLLLGLAAFVNPAVTTIAGDGVAGNNDGTAATARFMSPDGVAFDARSGTTYLTDSAGQRVRKIDAAGNVMTLAGSGDVTPSGLGVAGGYRDGPTDLARFDHPTGLAVAPDGAVYVADSFNQCIRAISDGVVTTIAGHPHTARADDGALGEATFLEPRGIALAADGTIYVADYGKGIRVIRNHEVTTLVDIGPKYVDAISLAPGNRDVLMYSSPGVLGRYDLTTHENVFFGDLTKSFYADFKMASILALDADRVLVSNMESYGIYAVSFQCRPLAALTKCAALAIGKVDADGTRAGGFRDGSTADALFYQPLGMAMVDSQTIVVADSANRRIRRVTLPVRGTFMR